MTASPLTHTTHPPAAAPALEPAHAENPARTQNSRINLRPTVAPFHEDAQARRAVSSLARQALEILNGYRPLTALTPFLTLEENRRLQRRATLVQGYRTQHRIKVAPRVSVGGTSLCYVSDKIVETTTVVRDSLRPRFVCMRWELVRDHWRITLLEFG